MDTSPGMYVSIDSVVKTALQEEGYTNDTHLYIPYLKHAYMGLKELFFDTLSMHATKTVIIEVNDRFCIDLPEDYVQYTKVGCIGTDGRVYELTRNSDILTGLDLDPCSLEYASNTTGEIPVTNQNVIFNNYWGPWDDGIYGYGYIFGMGGGRNYAGEYEIDHKNWMIRFDPNGLRATRIVLEYVYNPEKCGPETKVHIYCERALVQYIIWASRRNKRSIPLYDRDYAKNEYLREKKYARTRLMQFTIDELRKASHRNFMQTPKF